MNTIQQLRHPLAIAALTLLCFTAAQAETVSKADYKAGKSSISATYTADKAACKAMKDNARDICIQQAKGKEKVARAELEYRYTGKSADAIRVREAQAKAAYAVAKEKCDDLSGNPKDVCVKEAKAVEVKALSDARLVKAVSAARSDAASDVRDANYKVAIEKCDALSGDAKSACVADAKRTFGKT